MKSCRSPTQLSSGALRVLSPSLLQLSALLEDKVNVLQSSVSAEQQRVDWTDCSGYTSLRRNLSQSQDLISHHLQELQRSTEQEVSRVAQQLRSIRTQRELLGCELADLQKQLSQVENSLRGPNNTKTCTWLLRSRQELQSCIAGEEVRVDTLRFREQALSALLEMLQEDAQRFQQETKTLNHLSDKLTNGMPGKNHTAGATETANRQTAELSQGSMERGGALPNGHTAMTTRTAATSAAEKEEQAKRNTSTGSPKDSNVKRSGSVKGLIRRFSTSDADDQTPASSSPTQASTATLPRTEKLEKAAGGPGALPSIQVTPPLRAPQLASGSTRASKAGSGSETPVNGSSHTPGARGEPNDASKAPESPAHADESPATPKAMQNPKYQLFLGTDRLVGSREPDGQAAGEGGGVRSRWEGGGTGTTSRFSTNYRGSLESLASRDWDTMSDRTAGYESPPRAFNSPYSNITVDFSSANRGQEYKEVMSPATSEMNLFGFGSRSTSPVNSPALIAPRMRFSPFDSLTRRREHHSTMAPNQTPHSALRSGVSSKRDFIEELTKQLETVSRRNQFLEAESIELDKERNQIRFEMRGLLVNNEDLLRTNTQLQAEVKRMRDRMVELESDHNVFVERTRKMELELKEAREVMVEANTQEYAFNFLQQSLQNKIQDAEESLEKQTQRVQELSEKLWLTERKLEELELERDSKGKKTVALNTTVQRLESELAAALQQANQASAELHLQQKLRAESLHRVEELEETLMEKDQELQRVQVIINRLQGEVSGKLSDKEQSLEEEIQLRERIQLQCKQAERAVEDLRMELQAAEQSKEDLGKQLKQAQEKMIDLETDLEDMHESEQRWASKHKRAIEQTEQLQLKIIQEKDVSDQLEVEKVIMERQVRDLRSEIAELQNSQVQVDVITRAETKAKELENALRAEERNKVVLNNNISKLERKINELTDQLEEEHRITTEQKDLMAQRIRSLKRQLNEVEEEASRRETQHRHTQRELAEERETAARLQRQLLDQQLLTKRKESLMMRQTLDNFRLDLDDDDDDADEEDKTTEPAASRT